MKEQSISCRECVHLHIVNGRIIYARCLLGKVLFEKYGPDRKNPSEHTCPEWHGCAYGTNIKHKKVNVYKFNETGERKWKS